MLGAWFRQFPETLADLAGPRLMGFVNPASEIYVQDRHAWRQGSGPRLACGWLRATLHVAVAAASGSAAGFVWLTRFLIYSLPS